MCTSQPQSWPERAPAWTRRTRRKTLNTARDLVAALEKPQKVLRRFMFLVRLALPIFRLHTLYGVCIVCPYQRSFRPADQHLLLPTETNGPPLVAQSVF